MAIAIQTSSFFIIMTNTSIEYTVSIQLCSISLPIRMRNLAVLYSDYQHIIITIQSVSFLIIMTDQYNIETYYLIQLTVYLCQWEWETLHFIQQLPAHNNYNKNFQLPHNHDRPIPTCNTIIIQAYSRCIRFSIGNNEL